MAASHNRLSEHDLELLSAYIDGELTNRERALLEQRLDQDAILRTTLNELRETVALVRALPELKAPRNFILDPATYAHQPPWWQRLFTFHAVLQISGALGTAAAVILIALGVLLNAEQDSADGTALQESPADTAAVAQQPTGTVTPLPSPTVAATLAAQSTMLPPTPTMLQETELAAPEEPAMDMADAGLMAQSEPTTGDGGPAPQIESDQAYAEEAESAPPPGAAMTTATQAQTFNAMPTPLPTATTTSTASPQAAEGAVAQSATEREAPDADDTAVEQPPGAEQTADGAVGGSARDKETATTTAADESITESPVGKNPEEESRTPSEPESDDTNDSLWVVGLGGVLLVASLTAFLIGRRRARHL